MIVAAELFETANTSGMLRGIATAGVILAATFLLHKRVADFLLAVVGRFTAKTETRLDDVFVEAVRNPLKKMILVGGFHAALPILFKALEQILVDRTLLRINDMLLSGSVKVLDVAIVVVITWFLVRLTNGLARFLEEKASTTESKADDQIIILGRKTVKAVVVGFGIVYVFKSLNVDVGPVLAGVGILTFAVGFAAQDTFANFFGSIAMLIDRPFVVGDTITAEGVTGVVEELGLRSTHMRTPDRTLVSIPNRTIANAVIENTSERPMFRVVQVIGLTYDTSVDKLEKWMQAVRDMLAVEAEVSRQEFGVRFVEFAESSLDVRVLYWVEVKKPEESLVVQERVNLKIMKLVESHGLQFAFPSQTVYLKKTE